MYKLEMHLHTMYRSPCAMTDEKTIAELYHKNGYNGIVCTNHYNSFLYDHYYCKGSPAKNARYFVDGYRILKDVCAKYGIDVFFGMEVLLDCLSYYKEGPPRAELLVYGISPEWLLAHPDDIFALTPQEFFELCRSENWILSQAHPFRESIDVQSPAYLEGCEVYNGNPRQKNHNEKALDFAKKNGLLYTAGSDFHETVDVGSGVYLKNSVKTNEELVAELRKREHIVFQKSE